MTDSLRIGELAKYTHCQVETIRYYEQTGLLPAPVRSEGNYRLYNARHVERLSFIRRCRSLDMTLDEIRTLLEFCDVPEKNCSGVNVLLDEHIHHVISRIVELKVLEKQLKALRRLCNQVNTTKNCGILNELTTEASNLLTYNKISANHIHGSHIRGK